MTMTITTTDNNNNNNNATSAQAQSKSTISSSRRRNNGLPSSSSLSNINNNKINNIRILFVVIVIVCVLLSTIELRGYYYYSQDQQPDNNNNNLSLLSKKRLEECSKEVDRLKKSSSTAPADPSSLSLKEQQQHQNNKTTTKKDDNDIAVICTISKDSLAYVDEWVDYNLALEFTTIYIYDNSDDNELYQWSLKRNPSQIQVIHYPGMKKQKLANMDCYNKVRAKKSSSKSWIAFIDNDEFIVLYNHSNIIHMLNDVVPKSSPALSLTWYLFYFFTTPKSNNNTIIENYQPIPVTKRFLYRERIPNNYVKTIVRTRDYKSYYNTHGHYYKQNKQAIDTLGNKISPTGVTIYRSTSIATIHHYQTKSIQEYQSKCLRGSATHGKVSQNHPRCFSKDKLINHFSNNKSSLVYDDTAWKFLTSKVPYYTKYDGNFLIRTTSNNNKNNETN